LRQACPWWPLWKETWPLGEVRVIALIAGMWLFLLVLDAVLTLTHAVRNRG